MTVDESTLKEGGFIRLREPGVYALRVKLTAGDTTAEKLRAIADIADEFGDGTVHLTVRQSIEVRGVSAESFDSVHAALAAAELGTGASGPRVRVPVACPGSAICRRGLNDTKQLALRLEDELFGRETILPHKFKIAVTGCSASCAKPQENDIGFQGATRRADGGEIERGWRVFLGGCFGRNPRLGVLAAPFVGDDEALRIAHGAVATYGELGVAGERLRDTMDRVGHDEFMAAVFAG